MSATSQRLRNADQALKRGDYAQAGHAAREVVASYPGNATARKLLRKSSLAINAPYAKTIAAIRQLLGSGKHHLALDMANSALAGCPDADDLWLAAGEASFRLGSMNVARQCFEQVTALMPLGVTGWLRLAETHSMLSDHSAARACLSRAEELASNNALVLHDIGVAYLTAGAAEQARSAISRAHALAPDNSLVCNTLGTIELARGNLTDAETLLLTAVHCAPGDATTHQNLGNLRLRQGKLPDAVSSWQKTCSLQPGNAAALTQKLFVQARIGDWSAHGEYSDNADWLGIEGAIAPPWPLLAFEDNPGRAAARARHFARQWPVKRPKHWDHASLNDGKIRIGYVSGDVHDHATPRLLNDVLAHHDRSVFELHLFVLNPSVRSLDGDRMRSLMDKVHDVHGLADDQVVALARDARIDIAVDLKGYTQGARPSLFATGLAPVQINYLGYPGTLGSSAWDYIIADRVVIPDEARDDYDEEIIYLPGCYQPNGGAVDISAARDRRQDHGLPDDAVVLCCFNDSYKIGPREFRLWMELLRRRERAVLWLLGSNRWFRETILTAAQAEGIDHGRIIFADIVPQAQHLQRQRHADLFLDCFNVNAHTTASDALRAGLPVLSLCGKQFAARVGASLLHAAGLPELAVNTHAEFLSLASELIADPIRLKALRERLRHHYRSKALFDPISYVRNLEAAFLSTRKIRSG